MSDYLPYDEESDKIWLNLIKKLLERLYDSGDFHLLCIVISNIYEYCVWKSHTGVKSLNVKDIKRLNENVDSFTDMCTDLYTVRNYVVHCPYKLPKVENRFLKMLSSPDFKYLLQVCFPDDYKMFDEMLSSYSRWLYE